MVLVAGGSPGEMGDGLQAGISSSSPLYNAPNNTWSENYTFPGSIGPTATRLPSGQVLVTGGRGTQGDLARALLYDPASNTWSAAASLATARAYHTATLLPSGQVLVVGGVSTYGPLASAELYDPASNTWSAAASLATARAYHTATLMPSGQVLAVGGYSDGQSGGYQASAELYDPASNTWRAAASLATARTSHTATLLPSGQVLVVGGYNGGYQASAELYDPASNTWRAAASLASARAYHTATLLPFGQVLVVGGGQRSATPGSNGYYYMQGITSAELFSTDVIYRNGFEGP